MERPKHLLKAWVEGYPKAECGKLVEEKDTTLIVEKVTCKACMASKEFKKLKSNRPMQWARRKQWKPTTNE